MANHWFVIHSKPLKEDFLCEQLNSRQIKHFYPHIKVQPVNPRARKVKPYFPGYLFVQTDLEQNGLSCLQWLPGAYGLVEFGGEPAYVSDNMIRMIRQRVDKINSTGCGLFDSLKQDDGVIIHAGPFAGYKAIFNTHLPVSERVRVLLKSPNDQRQIPVELPAEQIRRTNQY